MSTPEQPTDPAEVARQMVRDHGPIPDHLVQKVAAEIKKSEQRDEATQKPA